MNLKAKPRTSNIDYLDNLSDPISPFEKSDSFLMLSPDEIPAQSRIQKFAIEPI